MNKNKFIYSSFFIVLVNFIVMILDFYYNIKLAKFIGAEGIGLFQLDMSILMVALVISIGGIPTAVSKLVARENSKNNCYKINIILYMALFLVCTISGILIIFFIIFGKTIAFKIFKVENMFIHIYLLIPAIILISIGSVLRGYYYGLNNIKVPSVSQILENLFKLFLILIILYCVHSMEPRYGAMIAIISISLGESINILYLIFKKKKLKNNFSFNTFEKINKLNILLEISSIAIPIGISNLFSMSSRFVTINLLPKKLMEIGLSNSEAVEALGRIMGMAMPLISLPFMITSAMGIIMIPNLSGEMASKNYRIIKEQILFSIKITFLFSIPLTSLYMFFPNSLARFLYDDLKLGKYIYIMSLNTVFLSLQNILSDILHGLNKQVYSSINKLIGALVQISTCILVGNPQIGINGFFIGFYLSSLSVCALNLFILKDMMKLKVNYMDIILKPFISAAFMVFSMKAFHIFDFNISYKLNFFLSLLLGCGVYLLVLYILEKLLPQH